MLAPRWIHRPPLAKASATWPGFDSSSVGTDGEGSDVGSPQRLQARGAPAPVRRQSGSANWPRQRGTSRRIPHRCPGQCGADLGGVCGTGMRRAFQDRRALVVQQRRLTREPTDAAQRWPRGSTSTPSARAYQVISQCGMMTSRFAIRLLQPVSAIPTTPMMSPLAFTRRAATGLLTQKYSEGTVRRSQLA